MAGRTASCLWEGDGIGKYPESLNVVLVPRTLRLDPVTKQCVHICTSLMCTTWSLCAAIYEKQKAPHRHLCDGAAIWEHSPP